MQTDKLFFFHMTLPTVEGILTLAVPAYSKHYIDNIYIFIKYFFVLWDTFLMKYAAFIFDPIKNYENDIFYLQQVLQKIRLTECSLQTNAEQPLH